jgi:hypothetical protein
LLYLNLDIASSEFVLDHWLEWGSDSPGEEISFLPEHFFITTKARVNKFRFEDFECNDLKGSFVVHGNIINIDSVNFKTMDGYAKGNGLVEKDKNRKLTP